MTAATDLRFLTINKFCWFKINNFALLFIWFAIVDFCGNRNKVKSNNNNAVFEYRWTSIAIITTALRHSGSAWYWWCVVNEQHDYQLWGSLRLQMMCCVNLKFYYRAVSVIFYSPPQSCHTRKTWEKVEVIRPIWQKTDDIPVSFWGPGLMGSTSSRDSRSGSHSGQRGRFSSSSPLSLWACNLYLIPLKLQSIHYL